MSVAKQPSANQWRVAARWLRRVDQKLSAAELLLGSALTDPAAFHCQQAAEKLAKAVLIACGVRPPRTHNIHQLGRLVAPHAPAIAAVLESAAGLTSWYVAVRYATDNTDLAPTENDVRSALDTLTRLRQQVASLAPKHDE